MLTTDIRWHVFSVEKPIEENADILVFDKWNGMRVLRWEGHLFGRSLDVMKYHFYSKSIETDIKDSDVVYWAYIDHACEDLKMAKQKEMPKTLVIMDYKNHKIDTGVDLTNLDNIQSIIIKVISGDEIATVVYEDGKIEFFDSSDNRHTDYLDDEYTLYNSRINRIPAWVHREDTYDYCF